MEKQTQTNPSARLSSLISTLLPLATLGEQRDHFIQKLYHHVQ